MQSNYDVDSRIRTKAVLDSLPEPIIIRVNKFDDDAVKAFGESMSKANIGAQPVIPVVIHSDGGGVYSMFSMIDLIENAKKPVATIIEGKAMSAGATLAAFGTSGYRFAAENSTVMMHQVSTITVGKLQDIQVTTKEADRLNRKMFIMLAKKCGKPKDYFTKKIKEKGNSDWYLSSKEAKQHGLVDYIGIPDLTLKVSVDYQFGINAGRSK